MRSFSCLTVRELLSSNLVISSPLLEGMAVACLMAMCCSSKCKPSTY